MLIKSNLPCEKCGSSDAAALYEDEGRRRKYCFSCSSLYSVEDGEEQYLSSRDVKNIHSIKKQAMDLRYIPSLQELASMRMSEPSAWVEFRGYDVPTARKYRSGELTIKGLGRVRIFPIYHDGKMVGAKLKNLAKGQATVGNYRSLYGKHTATNKWNLVITEGEEDAEAYSYALGPSYNCVSVPNGATGAAKAIEIDYDWINQFEKIYVSFDMDEIGQESADKIISMLPPEKTYRVSLPKGYKDACEALQAKDKEALKQAIYNAQTYVEPGFLQPEEVVSAVMDWLEHNRNAPSTGWEGLDELLGGVRSGEITLITGGTGSSKSTLCRSIAVNLMEQGVKSLILSLEDGMEATTIHLVEHYTGRSVIKEAEHLHGLSDVITAISESIIVPKLSDHSIDKLLSKIEYAVRVKGCKVVFLDHITILAEAEAESSRHIVVEKLMANLRRYVNNLGIHMFVVSHQSKSPDDKDDTTPTLSRLKHSGALAQVPDTVLGIHRKRDSTICSITTLKTGRNWGVYGTVNLNYKDYRYHEVNDKVLDVEPEPIQEEELLQVEVREESPRREDTTELRSTEPRDGSPIELVLDSGLVDKTGRRWTTQEITNLFLAEVESSGDKGIPESKGLEVHEPNPPKPPPTSKPGTRPSPRPAPRRRKTEGSS